MKIDCIIVDDEPRAHVIIENYVSREKDLNLVGKFLNSPSAIDFLNSNKPSLVFLDIDMPEIDGFGFLNSIGYSPLVIFTTAYTEYAFDSYDYNTIDYLKKPIPFSRFSKAILKVRERIELEKSNRVIPDAISLKIDSKMIVIPFKEILYFQSYGNYLKVITESRTWLSPMTTKELEVQLPKEYFLRIHKSFIINKSKLESIGEDEVFIQQKKLPIGKTYKMYFKNAIQRG